MKKIAVVLLVLAFGAASSAAADTGSAATATAQATSAQDKVSAREKALARKARGKKKMLVGLGIWGASVVPVALGRNCLDFADDPVRGCTNGEKKALIGGLGMAAVGGVVMGAGYREWRDANRDIERIERLEAAGKTTVLLPITKRQALGFAVGKSAAAAGYRLRW